MSEVTVQTNAFFLAWCRYNLVKEVMFRSIFLATL